MGRRTHEQDVVYARTRISQLKADYMRDIELYLATSSNDQAARRAAALSCQKSGASYFNYAEEFVGTSNLLGAHRNALWAQGFAEDCAEILGSLPAHIGFLKTEFSKAGLPVEEDTYIPGKTAFANMQRMVVRYLTRDLSKALEDKFAQSNLPTYGFQNEARETYNIRIKITRWMTTPKLLVAAIVSLALIVLPLLNKGVVNETPDVSADYVGPGPHTKPAVVVFVHGIFGDRKTWDSQRTSFPQLLTSDPEFAKNVDAFLFEYYSPRFGPAGNVNELAKQLKAALEDKGVLRNHAHVVFLSHSMGGLVTRRALLLMRDLSKVNMIYFYATPTDGAAIAELASKISSSPQLKSMLPLEGNEALQQVQDDWMNWQEARNLPSYCAYEMLATDGVFVVTQSSARALCNRLPEGMTADHITIVKPPSRSDERYERFATALRETVTGSLTSLSQPDSHQKPPRTIGQFPKEPLEVLDFMPFKGGTIRNVSDEALFVSSFGTSVMLANKEDSLSFPVEMSVKAHTDFPFNASVSGRWETLSPYSTNDWDSESKVMIDKYGQCVRALPF